MFLKTLHRNTESLDVEKLFAEVVKENDAYIVDLNTSQLEIGKDSNNEPLHDYSSRPYAEWKMELGSKAPFMTPNLKVTGEFHEGFTAKSEDGNVFITSTDWKTGKLKGMYGDDIFGLTDDSKKDLKTITLPTLLDKIRDGLLRS